LILCDTSAWIDALRRRGTPAAVRLDALVAGDDVVVTDVVVLELLAGARDDRHLRELERMLARFVRVATEQDDFEQAASIYRACRRRGSTPRSLLDCVIAAVAIRVGASVLHNDRDFDTIAAHVPLTIDGG
jgi:predicted nucleic acid-binding protein